MRPRFLSSARLGAVALGVICIAGAGVAQADPVITIGLQEAGYNNDATKTVASLSAPTGPSYTGVFGTFSVNKISGDGDLLPGDIYESQSINTSTTSSGTLNVFVTESGITSPTGASRLLSGFTLNAESTRTKIASVTESTYYNSNDSIFGKNTFIASHMFTPTTASQSYTNVSLALALTGTYSITEEYTIVSDGSGQANGTITIQTENNSTSLPEPGSLALLGTGVLGLGFVARRKRRRA